MVVVSIVVRALVMAQKKKKTNRKETEWSGDLRKNRELPDHGIVYMNLNTYKRSGDLRRLCYYSVLSELPSVKIGVKTRKE